MAKQETKNSNYTNFYLVMLILTTINFAFHLPSFADIPNLLQTFSSLPFFVTISFVDMIFILVGVAGLVYLYQKHVYGYWIMLGYIVAQIIITLLLLLNLGQTLEYYSLLTPAEKMTDQELVAYSGIMYGVFYVIMAIGIVFYTAMGTLWHFAWKNQLTADATRKTVKK